MTAVPYAAGQSAPDCDRALRRSLAAMDEARRCAVLWFAEIRRRHLYRDLGYSSINQYARQRLGFSKTRTGDFLQLARKLEALPKVRAAVADGSLGYTKAREVITVATPATEDRWLEAARRPRRELAAQVKRARRAAQADPGQGELLPPLPTVVAPAELPVRLTLELTPEQEARRAALVERLHKLGGVPSDRAELLLEALAALVEAKEDEKIALTKAPRGARRGAHPSGPPVQIHVHERADGTLTIPTDAGPRPVGRADAARLRCDAVLVRPGRRNAATIAPSVRREVMARDGHRCRAPGCGRTRFLEVHHVVPRERGGSNAAANLVTLCAACHRLWHERDRGAVAAPPGG
jgi:hypothetical protein